MTSEFTGAIDISKFEFRNSKFSNPPLGPNELLGAAITVYAPPDGSLPAAFPELRGRSGATPVKGRLLVAVCQPDERRLIPCPPKESHARR